VKRKRGEQSRKAIKVIEILYETMARNRYLSIFDVMQRLPLLCKKLYKQLDMNKCIEFISEEQRYRLYAQKCKIYDQNFMKVVDNAISQYCEGGA
jgi:hypothetical protein